MIVYGNSITQIAKSYNIVRVRRGMPPYRGQIKLEQGLHGSITTYIEDTTYTVMVHTNGEWRPAPSV